MENDTKIPKEQLRIAYAEILRGCSSIELKEFGTIQLKHLTVFDTELIDEKRENNFTLAKKRGLPTQEEKLEELASENLWTKDQEKKIAELEDFISRLNETKSKMILKSESEKITKEIQDTEEKVKNMRQERDEMIGITCESFSEKKANDYYIYLSLFKDKEFSDPFFTEEEFDELNDEKLTYIIISFNKVSKRFSQINLKRIALSGFFLNNFYLCKENPFTFYGQPVVNLTFNQSDLFAYGRYFKSILSDLKSSPPPDVMEDPDKLLEQYHLEQNKEKILGDGASKSGTATTLVGATKEDMEALGLSSEDSDGEVINLDDAVKESGGTLSMDDLIKLHGA
tara:strand:+ start:5550 stop:6572 length:1023 start_codon:yes stop_codon:yes gene_type:complete